MERVRRVEVRWPELRDPPCAIYFKVYCQLEGESGWKGCGQTAASYDTSVSTEVLKPGARYAVRDSDAVCAADC